jgi:hypothetical protein
VALPLVIVASISLVVCVATGATMIALGIHSSDTGQPGKNLLFLLILFGLSGVALVVSGTIVVVQWTSRQR